VHARRRVRGGRNVDDRRGRPPRAHVRGDATVRLYALGDQARSVISHWFPYDRVGAVHADP